MKGNSFKDVKEYLYVFKRVSVVEKKRQKKMENIEEMENIIYNEDLSEDFIRKNPDNVNWYCISVSQKLSESLIRDFQDRVNWLKISEYQFLSEAFIREFQDRVNWLKISKYQILSESFILEFKDKVYWYNIYKYQPLFRKAKENLEKSLNSSNLSQYDKSYIATTFM